MVKLMQLKRQGAAAAKVVRGGHIPAMMFGNKVLGTTPSARAGIRRDLNAALPGRPKGRSCMLRLMAYNVDPSADACAQTIYCWAAAVWEELTSRPRLQQAWMRASVAKMAGELSWRTVVGPAAAVALISEELDWKWVSATAWTTAEGILLDAAMMRAQTVAAMDSQS